MAKADSKQKNVRLRLDAWFALEELQEQWNCSRDTALERAIVDAHQAAVGETSDLKQFERAADSHQDTSFRFPVIHTVPSIDPAAIPGVTRGPSPNSLPFPCRCVHSGCQGAKFQGASRFANCCSGCEEKGHTLNPRECPACFDDVGAV